MLRSICMKTYFDKKNDTAESNWNYVKNGIAEINDNSRCNKALKNFKNRVTKVSDDNDSI